MSSNFPRTVSVSLLLLATSALAFVALMAYTIHELTPHFRSLGSTDDRSTEDAITLLTVLEAQLRLEKDKAGEFVIFPVHKNQPMHVRIQYDKEVVEGETYSVQVGTYSFVSKDTGVTIAGPYQLRGGQNSTTVVSAPDNGSVILRATADRKAILKLSVKQP
jgi:hypothetical protein